MNILQRRITLLFSVIFLLIALINFYDGENLIALISLALFSLGIIFGLSGKSDENVRIVDVIGFQWMLFLIWVFVSCVGYFFIESGEIDSTVEECIMGILLIYSVGYLPYCLFQKFKKLTK